MIIGLTKALLIKCIRLTDELPAIHSNTNFKLIGENYQVRVF